MSSGIVLRICSSYFGTQANTAFFLSPFWNIRVLAASEILKQEWGGISNSNGCALDVLFWISYCGDRKQVPHNHVLAS